jgi:segregation and condensation protein B
VPGRPALYSTTRDFLDYFNLQSLSDLPPLSEPRDLLAIGAELGHQIDVTEKESAQQQSDGTDALQQQDNEPPQNGEDSAGTAEETPTP